MAETFRRLAAALTMAIVATMAVGFWSFFTPPDAEAKDQRYILHFFLGLATVIGGLFVHCLVFIYFLGTGRWVKEVAIAYRIPDDPLPKRTRELKRLTFPPALFAMLIGIVASAAGAGVQLREWRWEVHMISAFATLLINLWAFRIEYRAIAENLGIIDGIVEEVELRRAAAGLKPNAQALEEDG